MRRVLLLFGITLIVWISAAVAGDVIWGPGVVVVSLVAMAICVLPALISLYWANRAWNQTPQEQLTMVLGGTGIRLFAVLGGAYALERSVPYLDEQAGPGFWTWITGFYLLTLALETALCVSGRNSGSARAPQSADHEPQVRTHGG
jgi:hypothetical protein